jgi:DNA-binding transcriptional LysR family regulator
MEMYQVRYFLSVARALNFTRAAEECDVAQPSLSRAIKQLEAELGGDLFRRERPQAILTELGQRMLPILTRCYESAKSARALAAAVRKGEAGALNLALSRTIELGLFLPHIHELKKLFNGLTLILRRGSLAETLDYLKSGDAEVGIAAAKGEQSQLLESWPLFDEDFLVSCRPDHRLAKSAAINLEDLCAERFVLARHCEYTEILVSILRKKGVLIEGCHEAYSDDDLMKLVAENAGIAIVPRSIATFRSIAHVTLKGLDLRRTVYVLGVAGRPRTVVASTFIRLLRAASWSPATN